MRVLILTTHVPFVRGGAEIHAEELRRALRAAGHEAEVVAIPFKWYPPERILDQILACRLLDVTEADGAEVDLVIGLKFPAYLIPHPNKVLWILHQHRSAYDFWDHPLGDLVKFPDGAAVREAVAEADRRFIPEARAVFANSRNVARRLKTFNGIDSVPLYHPPASSDQFFCAEPEDYLFFPSRLAPGKRQDLVLKALARCRNPVRVRFASCAGSSGYAAELRRSAADLGLDGRAEFLGEVTEPEKRRLYAHARGVVYPPVDEDFGYVTLEAMLASKPVITCRDSGGPLEFIRDGESGLVTEPTPEALADAFDEVWSDRRKASAMGRAGREAYAGHDIGWDRVVELLMS